MNPHTIFKNWIISLQRKEAAGSPVQSLLGHPAPPAAVFPRLLPASPQHLCAAPPAWGPSCPPLCLTPKGSPLYSSPPFLLERSYFFPHLHSWLLLSCLILLTLLFPSSLLFLLLFLLSFPKGGPFFPHSLVPSPSPPSIRALPTLGFPLLSLGLCPPRFLYFSSSVEPPSPFLVLLKDHPFCCNPGQKPPSCSAS